ncbi:MAG: hypothetical protein Q9217_005189 [Psora testacea]
MGPESRKTRFVCVSDTHNISPADGAFKLPKGDVLIHAGDLTKQGTYQELKKTLDWIDQADCEVKLVVAGNHDITLDLDFYAEHGMYFHNQHPQDPKACVGLVKQYKSTIFLNHESTDIRLMKQDGPRTSFKVFGSPYSPRRGLWAFGYGFGGATKLWDQIPLNTDILITHTPPKYHCDESSHGGSGGCETLRQTLWRVRPSLAICGHIHEARGAERVLWDLAHLNVKYKEHLTRYWEDTNANNKKHSLLDMSAKSPEPLQNRGPWISASKTMQDSRLAKTSEARPLSPWVPQDHHDSTGKLEQAFKNGYPAVRGQGGEPPSGRCDMEALDGRMDRKETCIVNAAIMASSWPYRICGGRKYNNPIVVDIDLPCWTSEEGNEVEVVESEATELVGSASERQKG